MKEQGDKVHKVHSYSFIERVDDPVGLSSAEESILSSDESSSDSAKRQKGGLPHSSGESELNASSMFFSENVNDNHIEDEYNDVPFANSSSASSTAENVSDTSLAANLDYLNISNSSLVEQKKEEYSNEIPDFYLPEKLNYPYRSPYDFSDAEFEKMNHFDFLQTLNFREPPLLPPYLNSNLLNDSPSHNYRTYPYQYQYSNHVYINDQYRYNINDLNLMDKYSRQVRSKSIRETLKKRASDQGIPTLAQLRHADYVENVDHEDIPNHVMLNHLITCNSKVDNVLTGSCIHRYAGKFITQIVYFPIS
ncbi:hypothetical protein OGAPHI_000671 [Ogataea philodendri]|uniref:Association with the SNF1 complex (ASC) domain-containing protein n=1 Tax=Ogataea philodendri TaxID=1378263 RepID=A0A9P8PG72_9ASCO|nr:uncharacterized protein OGAPHI_000671 [Ogataea philodendri]KAH3670960.1 hypothetical protein OGAPHI_000671 [Ogataea philodendri]